MRCRSIVLLVALTALLALADRAAAQRGGGGGRRPGSGAQGQPPPPAVEEKAPDRSATTQGAQSGFTMPDVLEAIDRGQGREALALYERAAADADSRGDSIGAGRAYAAVTFAAVRLGMVQKSIRAGTRALELLKGAVSLDLVGTTTGVYNHLGAAYRAAGDLVQARRYYEEGLGFAKMHTKRRGGSTAAGYLSSGLAHVAYAQGDVPAALSSATEAAHIFEAVLASMAPLAPERTRENVRLNAAKNLLLLARIQMAMNRLDEAEATLKEARAYARLVGVAEVDIEILSIAGSLALRRNDFARGLDLYQQGVAQATRVQRPGALIQMHHGVARSTAGLGRLDESLAASERALALIEEQRGELQEAGLRSGFLEDKQSIYQLAVRTALRQGKTAEAFGFAESARARAFLDLLGNQTTLSKGKTRALVEEEVRLRDRLAEARALTQEVRC